MQENIPVLRSEIGIHIPLHGPTMIVSKEDHLYARLLLVQILQLFNRQRLLRILHAMLKLQMMDGYSLQKIKAEVVSFATISIRSTTKAGWIRMIYVFEKVEDWRLFIPTRKTSF